MAMTATVRRRFAWGLGCLLAWSVAGSTLAADVSGLSAPEAEALAAVSVVPEDAADGVGPEPRAAEGLASEQATAEGALLVAASPAVPTRAEIEGLFERPGGDEAVPFDTRLAVGDSRLDHVRGGFDAGNGLMISFGIQRAVYINGELVTTNSLAVSNLGAVASGQALAGAAGGAVIQTGAAGSRIVTAPSTASIATVIQNTLNNQKIQNVTAIDAVVNSAQVLKGLSLQSTLSNVLNTALRR